MAILFNSLDALDCTGFELSDKQSVLWKMQKCEVQEISSLKVRTSEELLRKCLFSKRPFGNFGDAA